MWTHFWDMHSGGGQKENFAHCFIEAPENEAKIIFYNRFGHNPERVSCTCCGGDYSISEYETLEEATAYHRNCEFDKELNEYVESPRQSTFGTYEYIPLGEYMQRSDVLIIFARSILESEKIGEIPEQGYVWHD